MKKVLLTLLLASASIVCHGATEEVLWWMVEEDAAVDWYGENITAEQLSARKGELYARVSARDSSGSVVGYLNYYQIDGDNEVFPAAGADPINEWAVPPIDAFATLGIYASSAYSFAIELGNTVNGQWTAYAVSEVRSYDYLAGHQNLGTWTPGEMPTKLLEWAPRSFTVPEPCSGLLLLLGGGLLALRRRRRA